MAALKPSIVIPAHEGSGATRDWRAIDFMQKDIADRDTNDALSKTPAELRANVLSNIARGDSMMA